MVPELSILPRSGLALWPSCGDWQARGVYADRVSARPGASTLLETKKAQHRLKTPKGSLLTPACPSGNLPPCSVSCKNQFSLTRVAYKMDRAKKQFPISKQIAASEEIVKARRGAALFLPNQLFFTPGTEHFVTTWSLEYLNGNFVPDRWLMQGSNVEYTITPAVQGAPPPNQPLESLGILLKKR
jgi:hypothetical protein